MYHVAQAKMSDYAIKTDQHNLQEQNYCIITERMQVHQNSVSISIKFSIPDND